MLRSALEPTVPVAVELLLPLAGSVVPLGGVTFTVLSTMAPLAAVPVIVIVTPPPLGNVPTVPLTVWPATFGCAPHAAPPVALVQVAVLIATVAGTLSRYTSPSAACGPALWIRNV